jgi:hypothetical protein
MNYYVMVPPSRYICFNLINIRKEIKMAEVIKTAAPMWAEDYDSLVELLESIGDGTYDSQTRPGAVPDSTARS